MAQLLERWVQSICMIHIYKHRQTMVARNIHVAISHVASNTATGRQIRYRLLKGMAFVIARPSLVACR